MNSNFVLLHLSLIPGIGPVTIAKIVDQKLSDISDIYTFSVDELSQRFGLTQPVAQKIASGLADTTLLEQEIALFERHAIQWMTIESEAYPSLLRTIYAPPLVLSWLGAPITNEHIWFAMVGSRKANRYAQETAHRLIPKLVEEGFGIVSGGAIGADAMVHKATLEAGGRTIAVIGSGLCYPYPRVNARLFDAIVDKGGTILSSFPMLMQGMPGNFPARNRIIAGLSRGCLVLQAAKQSGARITARFALEQGRDVFAVPGPIDDPLSAGCHALIRDGATLVTSHEDILVEMTGFVPSDACEKSEAHAPSEGDCSDETQVSGNPANAIVRLCRRARTTDELLAQTGLDLAVLSQQLFDLQLEGKIEQHAVGTWEAL